MKTTLTMCSVLTILAVSQEEWRDDHYVFALTEGGSKDRQAFYHTIGARTYVRKDKAVLTSHQLSTLNYENIRVLRKQGKRFVKHDTAQVRTRAFTEEERDEMRESKSAIEGGPSGTHSGRRGTGSRQSGSSKGDSDAEEGASSSRRAKESSSSSSSSDDERSKPPPAAQKGKAAAGRGKKAVVASDSSSSSSEG
jgi:hypothetical protein